MNFSEDFIGFLAVCVGLPLSLVSVLVYESNQKSMAYQQAYNKNMECRQTMKGNTYEYIDRVCGKVPEYMDFVK
jgi:hypothetical protein